MPILPAITGVKLLATNSNLIVQVHVLINTYTTMSG